LFNPYNLDLRHGQWSLFQLASIHEEGAHTITVTFMLCVYSLRNKWQGYYLVPVYNLRHI